MCIISGHSPLYMHLWLRVMNGLGLGWDRPAYSLSTGGVSARWRQARQNRSRSAKLCKSLLLFSISYRYNSLSWSSYFLSGSWECVGAPASPHSSSPWRPRLSPSRACSCTPPPQATDMTRSPPPSRSSASRREPTTYPSSSPSEQMSLSFY